MKKSIKLLIPCLIIAIFALLYVLKQKEEAVVVAPLPEPEVIVVPEEPVVEEVKEFELKPSSFKDLKNWDNDDLGQAINTFKLSCEQIAKEKGVYLSGALAQIPTEDYKKVCADFVEQNISTTKDFRRFLEAKLMPYLVLTKGESKGKFTSYYEAALNASVNKNDKYKYPIYGKPADLIEFNPRDFDETATSKRYTGRVKGQKLIPYYSRAEIEKGQVSAPVILWSDSLVDIHIMQIQGSAVAYLPDGGTKRIAYADNNGLPFRGIGSILLEKGLLKPGEVSMGKIKIWLNENPEAGEKLMAENRRFIFHRIVEATGPIGAQGVPLTAGRSMAVDRSFIPLGALLWLETTGPNHEKIEKLMVAQDVGSAIKGAVRGDYFWGSGKDDVLELAGKMNSQGQYFILLPKTMVTK